MPVKDSAITKPIAITMGCPVGIGPEIVLRYLSGVKDEKASSAVVIGDKGVLERCAADLELDVDIVSWQPDTVIVPGRIHVLDHSELGKELSWGRPTPETGKAMGRYIEEAVRLIKIGELSAMVTCPITKTALLAGGYDFPGHTELLAKLCGVKDYAMMMAGDRLKVTLVTIHQSLATVPDSITIESVLRMISITGQALKRDFGLKQPRLAVAGLNPHAGEGGMFGDEEERVISPAVAEAKRLGWQVSGPYPPDTVFHKAAAGHFDVVVCMYHDQGLIPFKLIHFSDGVNVTLGLPIVRTSVDHGTAYDIAGKGVADSTSLAAAFIMATDIVKNRGC